MKKKIFGFLIIFSFVFTLNGTANFEAEETKNKNILLNIKNRFDSSVQEFREETDEKAKRGKNIRVRSKRGNNAIPDQEAKLQSAPDRILVKYKKQADIRIQESVKVSIEAAYGIQEIRNFSFIDVFLYRTYWDKEKTLEKLNKNSNIKYAEPDYIVYADSVIPNDPSFANLWGLHNEGQTGGTADADIDAPEAWDLTTGSSDVIVAVIDSGVDYNHEDLNANMWTNPGEIPDNAEDDDGNGYVDDYYGINAINNSGDPMDDHSHGTHCSGTIAAVGNNDIGVIGVCWTAKIIALKFLGPEGGSTSDEIQCIEYAIDKGVHIINASFVCKFFSQAEKDAVEASKEAGILFVAAAGNDEINNDKEPYYPASYDCDNIIAVAATDHNDNLASFSNYGAYSVDVAAPGVSIFSTVPNNSYDYKQGTSMAAPHVAGLAALIKSYNPSLTWEQIRNRILVGVEQKDSLHGKVLTGGRINAYSSPTLGDITSYTFNVKSSPSTDAYIEVTPDDLSGYGDGYTNFERIYTPYTKVTLTAPSTNNGRNFGYWVLEGSRYSTDTSISISMEYDHTAEAVYPLYTLTIESIPDTNIYIQVTPDDEGGEGSGYTNFTRKYQYGTVVTLTAPAEPNGKKFLYWLKNGELSDTVSSTSITVDNDYSLTAVASEVGRWTTSGPYSGYVNSMSISQTNPDIIYAGGEEGVYKTTDGAATWTKTGFVETEVNVVEVDPYNPDIVYAGTDEGLYKSENGGITWNKRGLEDEKVIAIAIDTNNSSVIYAGTKWQSWEESGSIFKSTDGGETWELKYTGESEAISVLDLLIDTNDSSYIYAAATGGFNGVLKSTDGGETWEGKHLGETGPWDDGYALTMTPSGYSPPVIYAIADDYDELAQFEYQEADVYMSTDRGDNWTDLNTPVIMPFIRSQYCPLTVDPFYPNWVYVGTNDEDYPILLYNENDGNWYSGGKGLPPLTPSSFVINPQDNRHILYVGFSEGGVYKSSDYEWTWSLSNQGLDAFIKGLAVRTNSSNAVFTAVKGRGFYLAKTINGGNSWDYLDNSPLRLRAVTADPQDPDTIFAGSYNLYKSTDGGQSWTAIGGFGDYIADIWISPDDSNNILVAMNECLYQDQPGVFRSTDGGKNWYQKSSYFTNTLACDPKDHKILYFGTERNGYVFRSTNSGYSWNIISPGGDWVNNVYDIEVDLNSDVYAATSSGLLKWDGSDWTELSGLPTDDVTALAIDRTANPETLYAGTDGDGVFVSQDGGSTWTPFSEDLEILRITKLAISSTKPKMIYAGTAYGGVWSRAIQQYTLTIVAGTGGTTDPAPGTYTCDKGEEVSIEATPDAGYELAEWIGNVPSGQENANPLTITMDSDKSVTANFSSTILQVIISGSVKTSGGGGIVGVTITFSNEGASTTTDSSGNYSHSVNEGWSGTATPSKAGYTFLPDSRSYTDVTSDQAGQDYTATLLTYTISGMVSRGEALGRMKVAEGPRSEINSEFPQNRQTDKMSVSSSSGSMVTQSGLSGVVMNGLPGNPTTDDSGNYSAIVDYGWSGTVTPTKAGYTFSPTSRDYTDVTSDQTVQDYTAAILTYTISGKVSTAAASIKIQAAAELSGVVMDGLPGDPTTDASGNYSAAVDYGWSGTVTPTKAGYSFSPPSKTYANVTSDQQNQSYTASIFKPALIIQAGAGGTTTPSPGTYVYDYGTEVSITATPDSGCRCAGWTGDVPSGHENDNPVTIIMDSDKTITATFIVTPPAEPADGDGGGKKGGCFIATAAYGSPLHHHLDILRDFRDKYLMPNGFGRKLVELYYRYSPSIADFIARHKVLKAAARINLLPFIAFSSLMVHFGPVATTIVLVFMLVFPILFIRFYPGRMRVL